MLQNRDPGDGARRTVAVKPTPPAADITTEEARGERTSDGRAAEGPPAAQGEEPLLPRPGHRQRAAGRALPGRRRTGAGRARRNVGNDGGRPPGGSRSLEGEAPPASRRLRRAPTLAGERPL